MGSPDKVAFFGLRDDPYSDVALAHLRTKFSSVLFFPGTTDVPPLAPDPGPIDVDWLFCFKSKTIFRSTTLENVRKAAINFHTAAPRYPGSGGVNWALYNGDRESAITVHRMTPAVDAGPIIRLFPFSIEKADTVAALLDRTYHHHLLAFLEMTSNIAVGGLDWLHSTEAVYNGPVWSERTYRLRDLDQLKRIDPSMSKDETERRIRATRYRQYGPFVEIAGYRFVLQT